MVALRDGLRWAHRAPGCRICRLGFQWLGLTQAAYPIVVASVAARRSSLGFAWGLQPSRRRPRRLRDRLESRSRAPGRLAPRRVTFCGVRAGGRLTGLAALLNSVRFNQIPSNAGLGLEMKVIAAVVVGGAAITRRTRHDRRHRARRRPARPDRTGADVSRRQRVLGARHPRRDHPRRGGARRRSRAPMSHAASVAAMRSGLPSPQR